MIAPSNTTFPQLVQEFFCTYLIEQRNVSPQTVASYRDTFRLLLKFLAVVTGKNPTMITLEDLSETNVESFLHHLEKERGNTARTRNQRFAAIRAFTKFAAAHQPEFLALAQQTLAIPMKRFNRAGVESLSREEIEAICMAPSPATWSGRRDQAMFSVMYNTGGRVSEIANLNVGQLSLGSTSTITICGKGRKERTIPLWKDTTRQLRRWLKEIPQHSDAPLFPNVAGNHMSRSGVEHRLRCAVAKATGNCASLRKRRISPHTIRHTTAMHMLQSGVDITVIAIWLGHESPTTTHMYVEADLSMKERALGKMQKPSSRRVRFQPSDRLLAFLDSL
jgi:site-specific recombinase XerD